MPLKLLLVEDLAGGGQAHQNDKNINPLSNAHYNICGKGVYCSPIIKETEGYGQSVMIQNKEYFFTFMHIMLEFVEDKKIIGLFLEMI